MRCFALTLLAASLGLLAACDRGLVYGERTGVNLAVRADPANSAPLEVNAGLQRRVVSSVPPQGQPGGPTAAGEAVNMVSRFDLERAPGQAGPFSAKVRIGTSFASGAAATAIAGKPEVVRAITKAPDVTLSSAPDEREIVAKLFEFTGRSVANVERYLEVATARGLSIPRRNAHCARHRHHRRA